MKPELEHALGFHHPPPRSPPPTHTTPPPNHRPFRRENVKNGVAKFLAACLKGNLATVTAYHKDVRSAVPFFSPGLHRFVFRRERRQTIYL